MRRRDGTHARGDRLDTSNEATLGSRRRRRRLTFLLRLAEYARRLRRRAGRHRAEKAASDLEDERIKRREGNRRERRVRKEGKKEREGIASQLNRRLSHARPVQLRHKTRDCCAAVNEAATGSRVPLQQAAALYFPSATVSKIAMVMRESGPAIGLFPARRVEPSFQILVQLDSNHCECMYVVREAWWRDPAATETFTHRRGSVACCLRCASRCPCFRRYRRDPSSWSWSRTGYVSLFRAVESRNLGESLLTRTRTSSRRLRCDQLWTSRAARAGRSAVDAGCQ